ncbi:MAG TPA: hypothetical protein VJ997_10495 [Longimicrobiales bacterium]|nr:hypothetical protein [Longimicrobiales bacterium]
MKRARPIVLAVLTLILALGPAGCASGSGGGGSPSRSSRSAITPDEIGDRRGLDVYTLVEQLRPNWLRSRGQSTPGGGVRLVRVVVDTTLQPGSVEVLRTLRASQVEEIQYLSGQDATTRYGLDVEGGVIVVTTDRGR